MPRKDSEKLRYEDQLCSLSFLMPIQCPIIERLTCSLMMNGRNNGKKLKAVRIVAHSFEIVRNKEHI
jgi:ribosomal protein S7